MRTGYPQDSNRRAADARRRRKYRIVLACKHNSSAPDLTTNSGAGSAIPRPASGELKGGRADASLSAYFHSGVQTTYWSAIASWSPCFSRWKYK